jgi:hypothetical protein
MSRNRFKMNSPMVFRIFLLILCQTASTILVSSVRTGLLYEESFSEIRFPLLEDGLRNYGGYGANPNPAGADGDLISGSLN